MKEVPEGFYEKRTEDGLVLCRDYEYKGAKLQQRTLTITQALDVTDVLLSLNVKGLADISDVGAEVNVQSIIREAIRARKHGALLSLLLWTEEDAHPDPALFERGLADEFIKFAGGVMLDFFTLNATLTEHFVEWFIRISSRLMQEVMERLPLVQRFIVSQAETLVSAATSSGSTKRKRSSGSRSQ
jgi:hypothetical protein